MESDTGPPARGHPERNGMFEFEWDPAKAASNIRKHEIGFDLAARIFYDRLMRSIPDEDHGGSEERWITMGCVPDGRLLVVSHTFAETGGDKTSVRIISARRATRNEWRQYESGE